MTGFNLSEWALSHRSLMVYFMIVAVLAGVLSYFRLGRNEDPSFVIKTMVVQAAWPGATVEDTLKQVTERLERKLQETPKLDFLRSFTRAGVTTIFVNLQGSATAREVPDIWYHVRKSIGDIRHTLPAGIVGPGFNDEFGDTFGIIYGFTADGFTHRELRDYVEDVRSKLLQVPRRLEDRDPGRAGREDLRRVLDAGARQPRHRSLGADRRAAGAERGAAGRHHPDRRRDAVAAGLGRVPLRAGCAGRQLRRRRAHAPPQRHRPGPARLFRSAAADVSRQRRAGHRPRHRHARRRRHPRAGQEHQARDGRDHRRSAARHRAEAGGRSGGDGRQRHRRIHDVAVAGDRDHPGGELHQPRRPPRPGHRAAQSR